MVTIFARTPARPHVPVFTTYVRGTDPSFPMHRHISLDDVVLLCLCIPAYSISVNHKGTSHAGLGHPLRLRFDPFNSRMMAHQASIVPYNAKSKRRNGWPE